MKKVLTRGIKEISKVAKRIAVESPNTVSAFLHYEPKAPQNISVGRKNDYKMDDY